MFILETYASDCAVNMILACFAAIFRKQWIAFLDLMDIFFSLVLSQKLDDAAVRKVFLKSLDNYIKWCDYLCIQPSWSK